MEDTKQTELQSVLKHWIWFTSLISHVVAILVVAGVYSVNWQRTGSLSTTIINAFDVEGAQAQEMARIDEHQKANTSNYMKKLGVR